MLREMFIGKRPSHFHINTAVKSFIVSEIFLWSSYNSIMPIFAIFAASHISGGNTEIAASSFSTYLVFRVIFELLSGMYLSKRVGESSKIFIIIVGILLISLAYLGYSFTKIISMLYIFSAITGMGLGIASPAKNSLFSTHLDKDKEATEWSIYDATVYFGMALSGVTGGIIAHIFGFPLLFLLASFINCLSIIPYLLYISSLKVEG